MPAPPTPSAVLLVRHGETEWSATGQHTGRTDLPLTDTGEVEAVHAGAVVAGMLGIAEPAAVYTSPRRRAQRTAELVLGSDAPPATVTELIAEYDYGDYEGLTSAQIREHRPGWDLWRDGCPGGESPADVLARAEEFVRTASLAAGGGIILAFTHGHMSRALTAVFLGLGAGLAAVLHNDTASIAEMRTHNGALTLVGWNLRPHAAAVRPY